MPSFGRYEQCAELVRRIRTRHPRGRLTRWRRPRIAVAARRSRLLAPRRVGGRDDRLAPTSAGRGSSAGAGRGPARLRRRRLLGPSLDPTRDAARRPDGRPPRRRASSSSPAQRGGTVDDPDAEATQAAQRDRRRAGASIGRSCSTSRRRPDGCNGGVGIATAEPLPGNDRSSPARSRRQTSGGPSRACQPGVRGDRGARRDRDGACRASMRRRRRASTAQRPGRRSRTPRSTAPSTTRPASSRPRRSPGPRRRSTRSRRGPAPRSSSTARSSTTGSRPRRPTATPRR